MILNEEQIARAEKQRGQTPDLDDLLDTIAGLRRQLAERDTVRDRCLLTGNLCGTDTHASGHPCMCNNCRSLATYVQQKVDEAVLEGKIFEHRNYCADCALYFINPAKERFCSRIKMLEQELSTIRARG